MFLHAAEKTHYGGGGGGGGGGVVICGVGFRRFLGFGYLRGIQGSWIKLRSLVVLYLSLQTTSLRSNRNSYENNRI